MGYFSKTDLKNRWWMHLDYNKTLQNEKYPNALTMTNCYQSSLYFEDSDEVDHDSFICCPGSHQWDYGDNWVPSDDRHHVAVPHDDDRVKNTICKLIMKKGDMVIWKSNLAHMGGYLRKTSRGGYPIKMVRLKEHLPTDFTQIKQELEDNGVVLVTNVILNNEILNQFCYDISKIYDIKLEDHWTKYPEFVLGRVNKGGGVWGPIACSKSAWDARLVKSRVDIFKYLLGTDDICVSIDSMHINKIHKRFSSMASFCPKSVRTEDALKRKIVAQIYGLNRTTHWANIGQFSKFSYGLERNSLPQQRFEQVSRKWQGHGSLSVTLPFIEEIRNTYVKQLHNKLYEIAKRFELHELEKLIDKNILIWL